MKNLYGLIMAGGSGTRLWPISRDYYPKQFLQLIGKHTLIQQTFLRLKKIIPTQRIYITTNRIFVDEIIAQLEKYGLQKENIIIQPANKDTGPAMTWAAKKIYDEDKSAVIVNCPSDHLISPQSKFVSSLNAGYKLTQNDLLVTFGIKPQQPNPEYGYITMENSLQTNINSHTSSKVKQFIEKPEVKKASLLIKRGACWNSGIFMWKADIILEELKKYDEDTYDALNSRKKYFSLKGISIDKSILEKSELVWVIPVDFDWKDIGSWKVLYELLEKDADQNVINNRAVAVNSKNSLIYGVEGRVVTAINVKDMIIVDTQDSVLVAHRNNVHELKKALTQMEESKLTQNLQKPLVTIITPTFNDNRYLEATIKSILKQRYKNIEYIVIDGGSSDGTKNVLNTYKYRMEELHTMPKSTRFEKINKGIELANGEIISVLEPANYYINEKVIEEVVSTLEKTHADICWGDLIYVNHKDTDKIGMYWKSSLFKKGLFQQGWMPPYQTLFIKKNIYDRYGNYNTRFSIASDYELMLRLLEKRSVKSSYIPQILVKMEGKGVTVKSILDRYRGNIETYYAWKENMLEVTPLMIFSKNASRIKQLWKKKEARFNA